MRKSIISTSTAAAMPTNEQWRDLERIARVEISSEDAAFPIEHALGHKQTTGWRAAGTGPQVIRLHFDEPLNIRRLHLHFVERTAERSQEFAVYAGTGTELKEVVRQQWTFSPHGSTDEIEDYSVSLSGITTLELRIDPDRSHDPKQSREFASLGSLKLA
jgi:Anaphase-promoting complex, subunit 10 (APC10)